MAFVSPQQFILEMVKYNISVTLNNISKSIKDGNDADLHHFCQIIAAIDESNKSEVSEIQ